MNGRQRHSTNIFGLNKIIIFGGFDGKTMLNDVHMIDISSLEENILLNQVRAAHQFSRNYFKNLKSKIFNHPEFSDITIEVKDKKVFAHKGSPRSAAILATQCEKFWLLFTSDMQESKEKVFKIDNYSYEAVVAFLGYIYYGECDIDKYSFEFLFELLQISDEYLIDDLYKICHKKLKSKITVNNVCDILVSADNLNLEELKAQCTRG
jgi:hypothetical protein